MGPKKAAAKPKKKEGNPEEGKELDDKEFKELYLRTAVSLQLQLAERTDEASKAIASKRELQQRVSQISKDFEEEQKQTFELTQNMTNQYKGMQEELLSRINKLEETVQQLHDQLSDSDSRQERILKDKNAIIAMKDEEIANLKQKMDDMADEFNEMLKVSVTSTAVTLGLGCTTTSSPAALLKYLTLIILRRKLSRKCQSELKSRVGTSKCLSCPFNVGWKKS